MANIIATVTGNTYKAQMTDLSDVRVSGLEASIIQSEYPETSEARQRRDELRREISRKLADLGHAHVGSWDTV